MDIFLALNSKRTPWKPSKTIKLALTTADSRIRWTKANSLLVAKGQPAKMWLGNVHNLLSGCRACLLMIWFRALLLLLYVKFLDDVAWNVGPVVSGMTFKGRWTLQVKLREALSSRATKQIPWFESHIGVTVKPIWSLKGKKVLSHRQPASTA